VWNYETGAHLILFIDELLVVIKFYKQRYVRTRHAHLLIQNASNIIDHSHTTNLKARKSWIIVGSDDLHVRVFNYNTHEKVTSWEAHIDYIRYSRHFN
jgi:hypothetical protein